MGKKKSKKEESSSSSSSSSSSDEEQSPPKPKPAKTSKTAVRVNAILALVKTDSTKPAEYFQVPTPFTEPLHGLKPGAGIRIVGVPIPGPARRFNIDLRKDSSGSILFHFNPRFDGNVVVMNSARNGNWQEEQRPSGFPFGIGDVVTIDLNAEQSAVRVKVNGEAFATFSARGDLLQANNLLVGGDFAIHSITIIA